MTSIMLLKIAAVLVVAALGLWLYARLRWQTLYRALHMVRRKAPSMWMGAEAHWVSEEYGSVRYFQYPERVEVALLSKGTQQVFVFGAHPGSDKLTIMGRETDDYQSGKLPWSSHWCLNHLLHAARGRLQDSQSKMVSETATA